MSSPLRWPHSKRLTRHQSGTADYVVDTWLQRASRTTRVRLDALRNDERLQVPKVQTACWSNGAIERSCIIRAFQRVSLDQSCPARIHLFRQVAPSALFWRLLLFRQ